MVIKNESNKIGVNKKKGFTLIEIIVAVTIIIILSALAVPKVSGYISKATDANVISKGKQIYNAAMWSYSEQGGTFNEQKITDAVIKTTSITLADGTVKPDSDGKSVNIDFKNNNKDYELSIDADSNNYKISPITDGTVGEAFFSSAE